MTNYEVILKVVVTDITEQNYYFHYDTMDFLLENGILEDAEIVEIKELKEPN